MPFTLTRTLSDPELDDIVSARQRFFDRHAAAGTPVTTESYLSMWCGDLTASTKCKMDQEKVSQLGATAAEIHTAVLARRARISAAQ